MSKVRESSGMMLPGSVSRSQTTGTPPMPTVKVKSCGSGSGVVFLGVGEPWLMFWNRQTTSSPGSTLSETLVTMTASSSSTQEIGPSNQPGMSVSAIVWAPNWSTDSRNVIMSGVPALAGSVSRSASLGTPRPVRSKSKSCGSLAGSVILTIVIDAGAERLFVNEQVEWLPRTGVTVVSLLG